MLCGGDPHASRGIAGWACQNLGLGVHVVCAADFPAAPAELETFLRLWEREAALASSALLIEAHDVEPHREVVLLRVMDRLRSPILVSASERRRVPHRPVLFFDVPPPTAAERRAAWRGIFAPPTIRHYAPLHRSA